MKHVQDSLEFVSWYITQAAKKSAAVGRPISCKAGCFQCCKEPLWVERDEAKHIVEQLSEEDRERVKLLTAAWWEKYFSAGHNLMPDPREDKNPVHMMRYRADNLWCPLLKDGLCSAYRSRPMSCRMHNAVGSPKRCEGEERPRQKYMNTLEDGRIMFEAFGILCQNAPQALFSFDHLGVWLGHFLLGKKERSANCSDLIVTQKDP